MEKSATGQHCQAIFYAKSFDKTMVACVQLEKTTGKKVISNKNAKSIKPPENKKLDK